MLYPQENESREVKDLSGIWRCRVDRESIGHRARWFMAPLANTIPMPFPTSYNDLTKDRSILADIDEVWYERNFFVPSGWLGKRVCLRFASAEHTAVAWVNGREVVGHHGGFLTLEAEISNLLLYGVENRITVGVKNKLTRETQPPKFVKTFSDDIQPLWNRIKKIQFDFLNYAGLNRSVVLIATPRLWIDDLTVRTGWEGQCGWVDYEIAIEGGGACVALRLLDEKGAEVASGRGTRGRLKIKEVRLWEPGNPYLYTMECRTIPEDSGEHDIYRLRVGVRTVKVAETEFLINGRPFYFQGSCKREGMNNNGGSLDHAPNINDFNLMLWLGANSFRTSHCQYSEEIMQLADQAGFVVIDEAPAVWKRSDDQAITNYSEQRFSSRTLARHLQIMKELVQRDKNHPCVVMWSIADEPIVKEENADEYFKAVADETRRLDPTRPVTMVTGDVNPPEKCFPFRHVDVMCISRYLRWYLDPGHLGLIEMQTVDELTPWHAYHKKPLIVTDYKADTVSVFRAAHPIMFSGVFTCQRQPECDAAPAALKNHS